MSIDRCSDPGNHLLDLECLQLGSIARRRIQQGRPKLSRISTLVPFLCFRSVIGDVLGSVIDLIQVSLSCSFRDSNFTDAGCLNCADFYSEFPSRQTSGDFVLYLMSKNSALLKSHVPLTSCQRNQRLGSLDLEYVIVLTNNIQKPEMIE